MTNTTQLILVVILSIVITLCIVAIGSFSEKTVFGGILPRVSISILACILSSLITGLILGMI